MPRVRGGSPDEGGRRPGRRRSSAMSEATLQESALDFSAQDFEENELVLARNGLRQDAWWPGIILDPATEAPDHVRRQRPRDRPLCVMFYGPGTQHRTRDFMWASGEGDVLPLVEYLEELKRAREGPVVRGAEYLEAVEEVLLVKRGLRDRLAGAATDLQGLAGRGHGRQHGPTHCTSCEAQLDNFEMANARQLHGRCSACHDRFRKGNFCPVCEKVWLPTDKDMVGCDHCTFWVHAACDRLAAKVLGGGQGCDYACPQCRKLRNVHNRLVALQQAELAVRAAEPRPPRTAFHLFATEIQKRYQMDPRLQDVGRVVGDTWRGLRPHERQPYELVAQQDMVRFGREKARFEETQRRYAELRYAAEQDGIIDHTGQPVKLLKHPGMRPQSAGPVPAQRLPVPGQRPPPLAAPRPHALSPPRGRPQPATPGGAAAAARGGGSAGGAGAKRGRREPSPDYVPQPSKKRRDRHASPIPRGEAAALATGRAAAEPAPDAPEEVPVFCNSTHGLLFLRRQRVRCGCEACGGPGGGREFSCTQFEQHAGAGSAKKWKASLRVVPGGVAEVPAGAQSVPVGKWLEMIGMEDKPLRPRTVALPPSSIVTRPAAALPAQRSPSPESESATPAPAPPLRPPKREPVKREERGADGGLWEPWLDTVRGNCRFLEVRWAGDRCSVCDSDVDFDFDQLVSCDCCGITVHQSCYGVPELPGEDDLWLCRACELKEEGAPAPQCCLCPVTGGALKPTTEPGQWCHAACMQWIPEVTVEDVSRMEPISHIRSIQKERWDLNCTICKQRVGAKIQCSSCYAAYHPLCARMAGLHMEMVDPEGGEGVRLISYCPRHCKPKPQQSGVQLASTQAAPGGKRGAAAVGDDGNGLWNAQLFPPPPLVPVPDCAAGCARLQPIQSCGWTRVSHGTGTGHSSAAGYWIPGQPSAAELAVAAAARPAPAAAKPARARPGRRRGGGSANFGRGRPRTSQAGDAALGPPRDLQPEPLLPLPEGVPEEVPVHCNGRSAVLLLRAQRVRCEGQEMSASRFEALCGKGDAKKWKCSLFYEDATGEPVMMMQDWLAEQDLDRKALTALTANLAAVEAWDAHAETEVRGLLRGMLAALAGEGEGDAEPEGEAPMEVCATPQPPPSEAGEAEPEEPEGAEEPEAAEAAAEAQPPADPQAAAEASGGAAAASREATASAGQDPPAADAPAEQPAAPEAAAAIGQEAQPPQPGGAPAELQAQAAAAPRRRQGAGAADPRAAAAGAGERAAGGSGPEAVVGQRCEVHFEADGEWYAAVVRGYDRANRLHNLWYPYDQEAEWLDLLEEDRRGRVRWQEPAMSANLRASDGQGKRPPVIVQTGLQGAPPPVGPAAVGWRVAVWWLDDACFYRGNVHAFDAESGRHKVVYDDGEVEHLLLAAEHVRWERAPDGWRPAPPPPPPPPAPEPPAAAVAEEPAEQAGDASGADEPVDAEAEAARYEKAAKDAPATVVVLCNGMRGTFIVARSAVQTERGQVVSPTEFERLSGKAASKKWKASLRVDKGNGVPGITVGDWLVDRGLDAPRAPRVRSGNVRQHLAMRSAAAAAAAAGAAAGGRGGGPGKQGHRESCMCVICKQSRRTGKPWAGQLGAPAAAPVWVPAPQQGQVAGSRRAAAPLVRFGKRAFVRCTAQLVRGAMRMQPWQVPPSRAFTAEEWEAAHAADGGGTPLPDAAVAAAAAAAAASTMPEVKEEPKAEARAVRERRALTLKERLEVCQATERQRLTFCKSGIHGWGLIARAAMKQDSMIIEYRGEALRRGMADAREVVYRAAATDCYLFNVNDDVVIDATLKGATGRFTNHCCAPSMYTKVLEVDGQPHLVFFARQDVKVGQELTYDYRFKEEEGEDKLVCQCGAPNCRGTMN